MATKLRALTHAGILELERFQKSIHEKKIDGVLVRKGSDDGPPYHLLHDEDYSGPVTGVKASSFMIDPKRKLETREDVGRYMCEVFLDPRDRANILEDRGVGAWLALTYFASICKRRTDGRWDGREIIRYVPTEGRKFYRHQIFGPMLIYSVHRERARLFLRGPATERSDFLEQTSGRAFIALNPVMIDVMDRLYWDEELGQPKSGALATKKPFPDGALRRFVGPGSFAWQHEETWDFWQMTSDDIITRLPGEFDEWIAS